MAEILLRSPRYETQTAVANAVKTTLKLYVNAQSTSNATSLRYTIQKDCVAGQPVLFEISDLCNDYLLMTFNGTYPDTNPLSIKAEINFQNAAGIDISGSTTTVNHRGYAGYDTFKEGANPTIVTSQMQSVRSVFLPNSFAGLVPFINLTTQPSKQIKYQTVPSNNNLSVVVAGFTYKIFRKDCSKYGLGNKVTFINKYGALQDLWFFTRKTTNIRTNKDSFQSNIISSTGTYSVTDPAVIIFNKTAKQDFTLSSGFYPEEFNPFFEELLLSDQVWVTFSNVAPIDNTQKAIPVFVTNSSFQEKTSLNNRLIDYTFSFELAADYINNVR